MPKITSTTSCIKTELDLTQTRLKKTPLKDTSLRLFDAHKIHSDLQRLIAKYKNSPPETRAARASKFRQENHPALSKSLPVATKFHKRKPDLNQIPFFFSAFSTEIAKAEDIQKLPSGKKEAESTRLVAKRFIDSTTGNSIFSDPSVAKGNPRVQMQELPVREIRAQAATATIDRYAGEYIRDLYDHLIKNADLSGSKESRVTIYLIRPGRDMYAEDCTINFLSLAAQREVTESLNEMAKQDGKSDLVRFSDNKNISVLTRTSRSNASPIGRLAQQGYMDTSEIKQGDQIVIVDDHTQAGSTILAMTAALTEAGATVLAAVTPTTHPFCAQLSLSPNVEALLHETLKTWDTEGEVQAQLAEFGMPIDTLTNQEAMIIIACATDPENHIAKQKFLDLESELYGSNRVLEGESDSLKPVFDQKPITPTEFVNEMHIQSATFRYVIASTPIEQAYVLDWDNFLMDEKGVNYQLMHNALVIAAHKYNENYPLLADLANAVAEHRGNYTEGMPMLCMSQEQFTKTTIENEKILKKDMVTDLLEKMVSLNPELKTQFEILATTIGTSTKKSIQNILYQEFSRQYQKMIRPALDENLTIKETAKVPFPDVTPTLMPGAQKILERIRKAYNFVALISNKGDGNLQKEVNKIGLMHYFDLVSGAPELTQTDKSGNTTVKRRLSKPDTTRLEQILSEHHNLSNVNWTFGGDTTKDIIQAMPLIRQGKIPADKVRGLLVNPGRAIQEKTVQAIAEDATLTTKPSILVAETLDDPKLESYFGKAE
ncbi:MAG: HAD hydrolase-like protein [Burkholderiaceae bacterium]